MVTHPGTDVAKNYLSYKHHPEHYSVFREQDIKQKVEAVYDNMNTFLCPFH